MRLKSYLTENLDAAIKSHTAKGGEFASKYPWKPEYLSILKNAIKKQKPITAWRGLWFKEGDWDKVYEQYINPGNIITWPGIQSFTKDKIRASAYGSGGEIFLKVEIILNKYLDISEKSFYKQEEEVISIDIKWTTISAEYKNGSWYVKGKQI